MKHAVSLSLSLFMLSNLAACGPIQPAAKPPAGQNVQNNSLSVAEINSKADLFDMMLMVKGADGVVSPVSPDRLESLSLDGKSIAPASILLPGSMAASGFASQASVQAEASKVILKGQPWVIYGSNGVYTFLMPKTGRNSKLVFKLKGDNHSYELLRVANLSRGSFVLANGQIQGAFSIRDGFQIKPTAVEYAVMLSLIIVVCLAAIQFLGPNSSTTFSQVGANLGTSQEQQAAYNAYYALGRFDVAGFANYYQSNGGEITITTQDSQQLVFAAASPEQPTDTETADVQEVSGARAEIQAQLGNYLSPLLSYVGSWTPESDLVKSLIPGGNMTLEVTRRSDDTYRLSAVLASGTYAGEGKYVSGGEGSSAPLNLGISSGGKTLEVKFRLVYPNLLGATLLKADGVPELAPALNQEIRFKRNL
ncbi:MAG: Flp family type IVb pilin [Candidatus Sericytochromatia bacterium]